MLKYIIVKLEDYLMKLYYLHPDWLIKKLRNLMHNVTDISPWTLETMLKAMEKE